METPTAVGVQRATARRAALSESKWKIENYGVARREIIECRPRDGKWNEHEIQFEVHSPSSIFNSPF